MNSFTRKSVFAGTLLTVVFAFGVFFAMTDTAFAIGGDAGGSGGGGGSIGDGCCRGDNNPPSNPPSYNPPTHNPPSNPPQDRPAICHYLDVSDSKVEKGDSVTLSWDTSRASSVTINNGVGSVADDGSKQVTITKDITYTLTAKNSDGNDKCTVSIKVEDPKPELACDYFDSNKSYVEEDEDFTLRWETTGATDVYINQGIGDVADDGSAIEEIDRNTTYTLTATNGHETVKCTTTVRLEEDEDDDLVCELDISDDDIDEGDSVTLEWDNEGDIDEILLEDDRGNVLVDTDDGDNYDVDRDEIRVKPTKDTEYTLTVYGENGDRERCEVDVEVDEDDNTSVSSTRYQDPIVTSIKLTDVPYTGFEAGPFLTGLFYTLLGLWGVAMAYLLVVKRGSFSTFATAGTTPSFAPKTTMTQADPMITVPTSATAAAPGNLPTARG